MHTPEPLVACPSCSCHHREAELLCPHCGAARPSAGFPGGRPPAALLLGLALASGCIGKSVAMYGAMVTSTSPSVTITSPADGATVAAGDVEIDASVYDRDIGDLTALDVSWEVDGDAACDDATVTEDGQTTCVATLAAGDHDVSVTVVDAVEGGTMTDSITLHATAGGS